MWSPVRLCILNMIPLHWKLTSCKFSMALSLYSHGDDWFPPPIPPENHVWPTHLPPLENHLTPPGCKRGLVLYFAPFGPSNTDSTVIFTTFFCKSFLSLSLSDSTTCTPFNVASQKYGGSCLDQSSSNGASNGCEKVLDASTAIGWKSSTNESVNSFFEIGFHSTFIINKLRIMQNTTSGRRIQNILLEFSDHSAENVRNYFFDELGRNTWC